MRNYVYIFEVTIFFFNKKEDYNEYESNYNFLADVN